MRKHIFTYLLIVVGLFLISSITFAQELRVTIQHLLDFPIQFVNQKVAVEGKLMTIPTRANPYGEYALFNGVGNWIHVEPWLPRGARLLPEQRAFGKGDNTMAHQIGKWFLIKGELKVNRAMHLILVTTIRGGRMIL